MRTYLAILLGVVLLFPLPVKSAPFISEFLADNDGGMVDEDGETSDWIELYHPGPGDVNLAGWYLTDDAADLTQWSFPAVTLGSGEHLLVFASEKDRRVPGSELHTNFKLGASGEYLALVMPNGTTLASAFSPSFPAQLPDLSYGWSVVTEDIVLVEELDPVLALVPDALYDAAVFRDWRNNDPAFDESAWTVGQLGVGYERNNGYESDIALDVEADMYDQNGSVYIRVPFNGPTNAGAVAGLILRMKYDDGFAAFINGARVVSDNAPNGLAWDDLATDGRADDDAEIYRDFDISQHAGLLTTNNLLAIHGLNIPIDSSDLLILPELVARVPDEGVAPSFGYFDAPSPGALNPSVTYSGVVEDTRFTVGRGFFTNAFTETITCTEPGATLVYTLDQSEPSLSNGTQVAAPDAFTAPTAHVAIAATTVLRVRAVKESFLPTNIDTQTYLFPADVIHQTGAGYPPPPNPSKSDWDYEMDPDIITDPRFPRVDQDLLTMPTLSVAADRVQLWGPAGVYSNPLEYGFDWEAPCSVEYMRPDGGPGFQEDGGIRIQGSGSRKRAWSKKSMRLIFREMYGAPKLDYPLFGARGAQRIDNIVLRGDYFDSWTVHVDGSAEGISRSNAMVLRDDYGRETLKEMGAWPVIQGGWVHLYLNGMYWGVYNIHERPDRNFAEDRWGGDKSEYDVLKHKGPEVVSGDLVAWNTLMATVKGNITAPAVYASVRAQMDVDGFADYLVMNFWGGNNDWPHNNWYAIRHRPTNGPFTFVAWDVEHFIYITADTGPMNTSTDQSPGIIWARLRQNPEFLLYFADRVHKHFFNDGALTPARSIARFQRIVSTVHDGMNAEAARWGDTLRSVPYNTIDHFDVVVDNKVTNYFPRRTDIVLNKFIANGYYPATAAPELSPHGGQVPQGFNLSIMNSNGVGVIYSTLDGSDPRLPGGAVNATAAPGANRTLNDSATVKARIFNGGEWSALTEADFLVAADPELGMLVTPEIHYHPLSPTTSETAAGYVDADDFEFLEIMNVSSTAVDLSRVSLTNAVTYSFAALPAPTDRVLQPNQRLLLAANSNALFARYGAGLSVFASYDGKLNNGGDTVTLLEGTNILLSFSYNDRAPWPESPDGDGPSLVLRDPFGQPDHADPVMWRASAFAGGSPGVDGPAEPAYPANPDGDDDTNGTPDLVDYAVAESATLPLPEPGSPPKLAYRQHLLADRARVNVETSTNLFDWLAFPATNLLNEIHHNDGTSTFILDAGAEAADDASQFFRLRLAP